MAYKVKKKAGGYAIGMGPGGESAESDATHTKQKPMASGKKGGAIKKKLPIKKDETYAKAAAGMLPKPEKRKYGARMQKLMKGPDGKVTVAHRMRDMPMKEISEEEFFGKKNMPATASGKGKAAMTPKNMEKALSDFLEVPPDRLDKKKVAKKATEAALRRAKPTAAAKKK
jgi:hypothetical protein